MVAYSTDIHTSGDWLKSSNTGVHDWLPLVFSVGHAAMNSLLSRPALSVIHRSTVRTPQTGRPLPPGGSDSS